ncbi:hypothetical protein INT44_005588 [Umbelopsis vinacea]|uniref:SET domain-containing protein n=1 Tax=Umbelopsis vinacea TaxID=44442 RepID=A0A8H7PXT6_9FUNG|nr:hypothetical protein INT44_005588 [Umbelopsis vinacea]
MADPQLPTADRDVTQQHLNDFLAWLKENGAVLEGLSFGADKSGMNGVILTKDFESDQSYATIPFKLMITEPLVRQRYPQLKDLSSRAVMSLFLSNEWQKGAESFWMPYLSAIPNRIMTSMMFDEQDLQILQGTNLQLGTISRRNFLYSEYEKIVEILPESERKGFTWEVCLWGYTAISSRAFPYRLIDGKAEGEMMVPLADSFNHDPNVKVTWSGKGTPESGALDLITREPLKSGNQLFTTYGPKSNEELLLGYGFCIKDNPYDYVVLKPNFSQDPDADIKQQILQDCDLISQTDKDRELVFFVTKDNIPEDLLAVFRVLVMNSTETENYMSADRRELLDFVGYRNEFAMLNTLATLLNYKVQSLLGTEPDVPEPKPWQQDALEYRAGQLRVTTAAKASVAHTQKQLMERMQSNFRRGQIATTWPFLGILNPEDSEILSKSYKDQMETTESLENSILLTVEEAFRLDEDFATAVQEGYPRESIDPSDEEAPDFEGIYMMLVLIRERSKAQSKWRRFLNQIPAEIAEDDQQDEYILNIHASIIQQTLMPSYPAIFDPSVFTYQALVWADLVCQVHSVHTENDTVTIIPM